MRESSSIRARAGMLENSTRQAGRLHRGADELGDLQQAEQTRASKPLRNSHRPSFLPDFRAVRENPKGDARTWGGGGEGVPSS